jgi:hypothetical protein
VPYYVLDAAGDRVASGLTGQDPIAVPAGVYTLVVRAAGTPITLQDVRANNQFTRVELKKASCLLRAFLLLAGSRRSFGSGHLRRQDLLVRRLLPC